MDYLMKVGFHQLQGLETWKANMTLIPEGPILQPKGQILKFQMLSLSLMISFLMKWKGWYLFGEAKESLIEILTQITGYIRWKVQGMNMDQNTFIVSVLRIIQKPLRRQ